MWALFRVGAEKLSFVKDVSINAFGFASHVVSAATTQLCHDSMEVTIDLQISHMSISDQ